MWRIVSFGVFCLITLYVLYILVMHWKHKKEAQGGKLTPLQWLIAGPIVGAGYAMDVFVNLVVATAFLFDPPQELMLTARFQRYLDDPEEAGWRYHVAEWWKPRLNKYDPDHLE